MVTAIAVIKFLLVKYAFNHPFAGFFEMVRDAMPFFLIAVIMGMLLKFVRMTIQQELRDARIQAEHKEMQFGLLQSQLSPHFLFNVLNNLYGISLEEQERIPPLLLRLSNLLRYAVYGAKKNFVPLQQELDYILDYIEFEKIRISDRLIIDSAIAPITDPGIKIAPLILIVFIENAFKHAKNSFNQQVYINIKLTVENHFILFSVENSFRKEAENDNTDDESSGLGLSNTLKRLELLYGRNYELKQYAGSDLYTVALKLKYTS